ncbi:MAG: sulfatase [Candidatus Aminicenantaceae bacterium]
MRKIIKPKVIYLFLILLIVFMTSCQRMDSVYFSFIESLSYVDKESETLFFDFGTEDESDEKYLLKGWSKRYWNKKRDITFRWARGDESEMVVYFTDTSDRVAEIKCIPKRRKKAKGIKGYPVGEVFVNDRFVKEIDFKKAGEYSFKLPHDILCYGSNVISFRWENRSEKNAEARRARFLHMNISGANSSAGGDEAKIKVAMTKSQKPVIEIPPGKMIEYYLDLPRRSVLKFSLFNSMVLRKESEMQLAVYSEGGEKKLLGYESGDIGERKDNEVKLNQYSGETVKIVFSNSGGNDPKFNVSLINPVIYSSRTGDRFPSFWKSGDRSGSLEKKGGEKAEKYNVFIYLVDTLRADHLGCYGYDKATSPAVDKFAKDSILFENSFANASWTKPGVASVITGLYPNIHVAEGWKDKLPEKVVTLAEVLKSNGYSTIHIATNPFITSQYNFTQGADHDMSEYVRIRSSEYVTNRFVRFINENPELLEKPIFAYLHTMDPHYPYNPTKPFQKFKIEDKERDQLPLKKVVLRKWERGWSKEDIDYLFSLYDCEIYQNDFYFNKWINFLKKKGLYENSLIIFIADHGEQFNEHGGLKHGHSIYNEEIHVPIIIKLPGNQFAGSRKDFFVSQVDVFPTVLDFLNIELPESVDGESLFDLIKNPELNRTIFIKNIKVHDSFTGFINSTNGKKRIITYHDIHFSGYIDYEVYNLRRDFLETANLYREKDVFPAKAIKFRVDYLLQDMGKFAHKKEGEIDYSNADPKTIRILRALGYIK